MGGGIRMDVIYSIGAKLAGGGIGDTAYHAVRGINRHGYLKRVICCGYKKGIEIPDQSIRTLPPPPPKPPLFPLCHYYFITNNLFDLMAKISIKECDVFYGWAGMQLFQLRKAKEFGAVTVSSGASSHILNQTKLLEEEFRRFGINKTVQNPYLIKKHLKEFEECDYITAASEFVKESFIRYGVDKDKLVIIPFGVDVKKFEFEKEESDKFIVLFVGQVCLRKGVQYLLKAWKELNLKDSELRVCGKITPEFEKCVKKYKNDNVKFLGFVKDVLEEYKKASVFCFPSIEEGSALVTYEAMAVGLPLIVTYNSGSVARDGKDGFVIPIRDVKALKEKILYFYENPEEIRRMGRNARKHVEKYTWERYGERLVKFFEGIV